MQYTIRKIPKNVDRALRVKAKAERKSLNQALLEAVERGLGLQGEPRQYDDMDWFIGGRVIDDAVVKAIAKADVVHPDDWK